MISNLEYILNYDNLIEEIYISEILVSENELTNMFNIINVDLMISFGLYTGRNINIDSYYKILNGFYSVLDE